MLPYGGEMRLESAGDEDSETLKHISAEDVEPLGIVSGVDLPSNIQSLDSAMIETGNSEDANAENVNALLNTDFNTFEQLKIDGLETLPGEMRVENAGGEGSETPKKISAEDVEPLGIVSGVDMPSSIQSLDPVLLAMNGKDNSGDATAANVNSLLVTDFSTFQQLQLRAQILVYAELVQDKLPEESMMSTAFADSQEATEHEAETGHISSPGLKDVWENIWQAAAERLKSNCSTGIEGDTVNVQEESLEPGAPSTSPIQVEDLSTQNIVSENGTPALDGHCLDVNGALPGGLTVNKYHNLLETPATPSFEISTLNPSLTSDVIDNTAAVPRPVSSLEGCGGAPPTRSPSLDPWLPGSSPWPSGVGTNGDVDPNTGKADDTHPDVVEAGGSETPVPKKMKATVRKSPMGKGVSGLGATPKSRATKSGALNIGSGTLDADNCDAAASIPSGVGNECSVVPLLRNAVFSGSQGAGDGMLKSNLHDDAALWVEQARLSFEEACTAATLAHERAQLGGTEADYDAVTAVAGASAAAAVAKAAADAAKVALEAAVQARHFNTECMEPNIGPGSSQVEADRSKEGSLGGRRSAIAAAREKARKRATTLASLKGPPQSTETVLRAAQVMVEAATQAGAVLAKGSCQASMAPPTEVGIRIGTPKKKQSNRKRSFSQQKSDEKISGIASEETKKLKDAAQKKPKRSVKEKKVASKRLRDLSDSETGKVSQKSDGKMHILLDKNSNKKVDQSKTSSVQASLALVNKSSIVEGSNVEVMSDEDGLRGGWFTGKVLELKGGQALVEYDELLAEDGNSGSLREWVSLLCPQGRRPNIRLTPASSLPKEEGKRKQLRASEGLYKWKKGDHVDAFVEDGWWEGRVKTVEGDDDDQKLTVDFPGSLEASVVASWNLRPSLVWDNRDWVESVSQDQENLHGTPKKQKVEVGPRVSPWGKRKPGRKAIHGSKVEEDVEDSQKSAKKHKIADDTHQELYSAGVTTRRTPRQKTPPKRRKISPKRRGQPKKLIITEAEKKASGKTKEDIKSIVVTESVVRGPTTVSPISTRARSSSQEAVMPVKDLGKVVSLSSSTIRKPVQARQKPGQKKKVLKKEMPLLKKIPNLRNRKEAPSPVVGTPTWQKSRARASLRNLKLH